MEENETNNTPAEKKQDSSGCSCGCGGKGSNKTAIAIWAVLLVGLALLAAYTRSNSRLSEQERLLKQAYEQFEKQDFEASTKLLRQSAELGNAWAQLYYGGSLKKGVGTEQDMPAAVEWFRKSADQNCAIAFFELGVCYENGEGVAQDLNEAEAWYRKALDAGIGEEAQAALDRVEQLKAEATPEAEAERLLIKAQELFDRGDKDVECAELLRQSAELGNAWAQVSYGRFLCKGIGTALDPALAVEWFRKSADQGCPDAFYALGICYENGEGVAQDFDEAIAWYRKAVDTDIPEAQSAIIRVEKAKALKAAEK
ncbi:MAG: sel1 repeat family protein [Lentisphaeria bacterium]|nr:sel1 repeat family protein [Lentisphaeria bacterium]